jgi:hypothetical protein
MALNLDTIRKELSGAGLIIAMLYMDYAHIDDQPLKLVLLGMLGALFGYGGYQGYKNSQPPGSTPPQP